MDDLGALIGMSLRRATTGDMFLGGPAVKQRLELAVTGEWVGDGRRRTLEAVSVGIADGTLERSDGVHRCGGRNLVSTTRHLVTSFVRTLSDYHVPVAQLRDRAPAF